METQDSAFSIFNWRDVRPLRSLYKKTEIEIYCQQKYQWMFCKWRLFLDCWFLLSDIDGSRPNLNLPILQTNRFHWGLDQKKKLLIEISWLILNSFKNVLTFWYLAFEIANYFLFVDP